MKWLKWTGIVCAALIIISLLSLFALTHVLCRTQVTQRAISPSGRLLAEVSGGYCTVGPGWDADVMIRKSPFVLSNPHFGNASDIFYLRGTPSQIRIHWDNDSELTVECDECKPGSFRVWTKAWRGISVRYSISAETATSTTKR
jgi:hypothetical protein